MRPCTARDRARRLDGRVRNSRCLPHGRRARTNAGVESDCANHYACGGMEGIFRAARLSRGLFLVRSMTPDIARRLLYSMRRIRCVEETIAARYSEQKMRCPTHLSTGQEAVAAAVGAVLRRDDLAVSGHRAHAHYLAKGGSLPAMIAEIYGKATGCAGGIGGAMQFIDEDDGSLGSTAIVAGTVPVGVGLAYAMKLKRTD